MSTPLVVGFGTACEVAAREMERDTTHVRRLSDRLLKGIQERVPAVVLNGHPTQRWIGNLNLSFECVEGESLLMALKSIAGVTSNWLVKNVSISALAPLARSPHSPSPLNTAHSTTARRRGCRVLGWVVLETALPPTSIPLVFPSIPGNISFGP